MWSATRPRGREAVKGAKDWYPAKVDINQTHSIGSEQTPVDATWLNFGGALHSDM